MFHTARPYHHRILVNRAIPLAGARDGVHAVYRKDPNSTPPRCQVPRPEAARVVKTTVDDLSTLSVLAIIANITA
jgi:hypothetical protein